MSNALKIHFPHLSTDRGPIDIAGALRAGGHTQPRGPQGIQESKYDNLNTQASHYFQTVDDLDQADVLVYPYRAQDNPEEAEQVSEMARQRGIGCLFTSWGDADVPIRVPHGSVYRHSLFADHKFKNEFAMPAFCNDPLDEFGGMVMTREKMLRPTVAFCGFVSNPLMRGIYRLAGKQAKSDGLSLRAKTLDAFHHPDVRTNFICRNSFFGGTQGRFHHDVKAQYNVWQEFLHNVLDSDYTICVRGAGNFSYRFYEVLAAGRIPVFINTKCVLPFEDEIDWKRHCVWIEEDEIKDAAEIVALFHADLSNEEFVNLQMENRALWEEKLCPLGFYQHALSKAAARGRSHMHQPSRVMESRQLAAAMN
jgi:hypothetical protein